MSWQEEVQFEINNAEKHGYKEGYAAGLLAQVKIMQFTQGDVLVIKGDNVPRQYLENIRIFLKSFGVTGVLSIADELDISKLSEINLSLLGLERKK